MPSDNRGWPTAYEYGSRAFSLKFKWGPLDEEVPVEVVVAHQDPVSGLEVIAAVLEGPWASCSEAHQQAIEAAQLWADLHH